VSAFPVVLTRVILACGASWKTKFMSVMHIQQMIYDNIWLVNFSISQEKHDWLFWSALTRCEDTCSLLLLVERWACGFLSAELALWRKNSDWPTQYHAMKSLYLIYGIYIMLLVVAVVRRRYRWAYDVWLTCHFTTDTSMIQKLYPFNNSNEISDQ
jgi:hypothetical protein